MTKPVVLIVDDEENIINALKRVLRKEPYEIVATTNPAQALMFLECVKVSLLLTDQRMDGITGDEVIAQAKVKCPGVKCIKLTGYSERTNKETNKDVLYVIPKPWNDDELKKLIKSALESDESETVFSNANNQEDR